ncbi:MAG: ABC transporter permease [Actinomycetota bacterium]|nr:ABC transporter permease [Actinomycetota bacterium]
MSDIEREQAALEDEAPSADAGAYAPSVAERLAVYQRAGGIITPVLTAIFAFFMGGVIVAATGHNPLRAYKAIFEGTGLNWFFQVGSYDIGVPFSDSRVWFPWNTSDVTSIAAANLQQTLLIMTTLILTGLAVAFAFRCGLFNIGGQGQYIVGALMAVWVGSSWAGLARPAHLFLAVLFAALAGAAWAAVAGFLKATVGAHEVITTIMLNWIAYWVGSFLTGRDGPLQNTVDKSVPVSPDVAESAKLTVFWGDPVLQGLHVGLFVALAMLVVFWLTLNRTTLGYEVRAVGFNPEAARYGGISVARSYVLAMAISGFFAGLGGAMDMLGWQYRIGVLDIQVSTIGFIGIAVALLGRNTAVGIGFAALLFAALINGTSTRSLDPEVFPPELASNLTLMIQALVLLFIGADVLILYLWQVRRKLFRLGRRPAAPAREPA